MKSRRIFINVQCPGCMSQNRPKVVKPTYLQPKVNKFKCVGCESEIMVRLEHNRNKAAPMEIKVHFLTFKESELFSEVVKEVKEEMNHVKEESIVETKQEEVPEFKEIIQS